MEKVKALLIATNQIVEIDLGETHITGNLAIACIINWGDKFAELNLNKPEEGWKIYPD
jgi:hypothetical protein